MENMIALAQHALGQYGLQGAALHFVRHNENAIFRVQTPAGEAYVLRLHIHDASLSEDALMHRPRWLKSEMRFIQLLSQDGGLGVQRPLPTLEGTLLATLPDRQGYASMLSWVTGEPLNPADARLEAQAYTVGELTARLHGFVLAHPETSRLVRPRYDARRVCKAVEKLHAGVVMGLFSHSTYAALQEGAVRICALMERELRRAGAHGLVHSDLGLSNLIAEGNRVYPIDFGLCGHGPLLFDLGGLMGAFDEPAQRQAVLEGYTAHRPLTQADGAGIEAFFLASVYFFMAMHLGDPRVWEWFDRRLPVIVQAYLCPFTKGEPFLPGLLGRQAWQSAAESAVSGARAIDKKRDACYNLWVAKKEEIAMNEALKDANRRVVGARQVLRAIAAGMLLQAYIARDADPFVTRPVMDACEKAGVRFAEVDTMVQLGKDCGIDVKASVAGTLK